MTRTNSLPRSLRCAMLTVVAMVGVAACSSDSDKTSVEDLSTLDVSIPDISIPDISIPGISLPPGVTLPAGISDACQAIYLNLTAMTSVYLPNAQVDYDQVFGDLSAAIPENLQDDLSIVSAAFQYYRDILAANNNDATKPEVQAAIQALATDEINNASNTLQEYFEATCPQG